MIIGITRTARIVLPNRATDMAVRYNGPVGRPSASGE